MIKILAPGLALAATLVTALPAQATQFSFATTLTGSNELPANMSPAVGTASVLVDDTSFMVRVQSSFSGLIGATTQAHIHCCTATPGVGNIGVATTTPSFTGFPFGISSGSFDRTYDFTQATSFNPDFIAANGGTPTAAFGVLLAGLNAGEAYFNIHSTVYPAGELRGFLSVTPVPEPSTVALLLAGLGALGFVVRGRKSA